MRPVPVLDVTGAGLAESWGLLLGSLNRRMLVLAAHTKNIAAFFLR